MMALSPRSVTRSVVLPIILWVSVLVLSLTWGACDAGQTASDGAEARAGSAAQADDGKRQIRARIQTFVDAINGRDYDTMMDVISKDLIEDFPPMIGHTYEQFAAMWKQTLQFPAMIPEARIEVEEVLIGGDMAVTRSRRFFSAKSNLSGDVVYYANGLSMDVWQREADGEWRITRMMAVTTDRGGDMMRGGGPSPH